MTFPPMGMSKPQATGRWVCCCRNSGVWKDGKGSLTWSRCH